MKSKERNQKMGERMIKQQKVEHTTSLKRTFVRNWALLVFKNYDERKKKKKLHEEKKT